ncbi:portal protein [Devosia pacifica]|uniref:Portal protein n=1 Tax=Devosia pacifica TaxID=1335967 RepID=A0A918SA03_9HYPH|nr:phage portal protein [Devosia pacifica]GHA29381.1 portal protein [Devosia pacifica]
MPNWFNRLRGGGLRSPDETKSHAGQGFVSIAQLSGANWTGRGFTSLAREGYQRNPIVYRCVRLIAEAATRVPLVARQDDQRLNAHPMLDLLARPNPHQSGSEMLEAVYAYLQTAGNAYLQAVFDGENVAGLYGLRPDRVRVIPGADGWPEAFSYTAGGRTQRLQQHGGPVGQVLHLTLFDPIDDHYGMAPIEAAQTSLDIHNAASAWNKALLDNAARPSGALVYSIDGGRLTPEQFDRLKTELEEGFAGAANAGRPMVLEGGLDWKSIALSPRDMDFIEAKNAAARDIALAFGVPPMLLGIPGDNTYSNLVEANRALWRQTVVPLVRRVAEELSGWLAPAFEGARLEANFDDVEALAEDRAAMWERIGNASFLSDTEKRKLLGLGGAQ